MSLSVVRLTVTDFRCYEAERIQTDSRPVVLSGPNGAGKTNILEALSFLTAGRGLRRASLSEIQRLRSLPHQGWAVAATLNNAWGSFDIGTGRDMQSQSGSERRLIRLNGQPVNQSQLAEHVAMVWLTPSMDRLFLEGASERRRFLDRLVFSFDPAHAGRVSRYEKTLRERSRLLRDHPFPDVRWLKALEEDMATTGVAIAAARLDMVQNLNRVCQGQTGPFPHPFLQVVGQPEDLLASGTSALEAEQKIRQNLETCRSGEEDGTVTPGPHRSDLCVQHVLKNMPAELCSTGEQKALLIAIILAHARLLKTHRGVAPVILLDEIVAHLDAGRRSALFQEILSLQMQVWMTGTDPQVFQEFGQQALFLQVSGGQVMQA